MSLRRKFLFLQAAVLLVTVFLYHLGIEDRFFWRFWWYDIPMHILGGMWAALAIAWVVSWWGTRISFSQFILAAFAIGAGWEVFEYVLGIAGSPFMSYPVDTAKDLVDDCIGGALAYLLSRLFV
jgi:hypothetical protein